MPSTKPHVVIVGADDMGYSDLGCFGGEIPTPTLDRLGRAGARLSRFYNTTRCSPSRASMLTGLHPHQAGIGILTSDDRPDGYRGSLNERCLTIAEILQTAGYATCLSGKWHLTSDVWNPTDAWPTRRGFDRFFGTLSGCGSYYRPTTLTRGEQHVESDRMDRGIARIVAALTETGALPNTLLFFLSDNGASAEGLPIADPETFRHRRSIVPPATWSGAALRIGNSPDIEPGPDDTYASYGRAWANLSNTPFRFYKRWVHEGGISTPLIVHWPGGGIEPSIIHTPFQLTDIVPTVLEATGVAYPARYPGRDPLPLEGRSMLPALRGGSVEPRTLYWEHLGNAAIRRGPWKLVREHPLPWELYDLDVDRAELLDPAATRADVVAKLSEAWAARANRAGVIPWERIVEVYRRDGKGDPTG